MKGKKKKANGLQYMAGVKNDVVIQTGLTRSAAMIMIIKHLISMRYDLFMNTNNIPQRCWFFVECNSFTISFILVFGRYISKKK